MIPSIFADNSFKALGTIETTSLDPSTWKVCMELHMKTLVGACHAHLWQYAAVAVCTWVDNITLFWCPHMTCINNKMYLIGLTTSNLSFWEIISLPIKQHFYNFIAIIPSPYNSIGKGNMTVKKYVELHKAANNALKEKGQPFFSSLPCGHNQAESPTTCMMQVFSWILPISFNSMCFASGKYVNKEKLFEKHPISKAWYEATTLGNYNGRKRNNIMFHKEYTQEFRIPDEKIHNQTTWKVGNFPKNQHPSKNSPRHIRLM